MRPAYSDPKVVFDVLFALPLYISSGPQWVRSFTNPLTESPCDLAPEFMSVVIVIHGTETVTLARLNQENYRDSVERMGYHASLAVRFKACGLAANDYRCAAEGLYDLIEVVPSAMAQVARLQQLGYGLVVPQNHEKTLTIEEIR